MKRNAMRRNLRQSIVKSFGRYVAIALIIALGAGIFVGLRMSKTDMIHTGQAMVDTKNMFDFRMISTYGWTDDQVRDFAALEGVEEAEGTIYFDLIARTEGKDDDRVYRFYSIPDRINQITLQSGRMPVSDDECLADGYKESSQILGKKVVLSESNAEDSLDAVKYREFTVVGLIYTPIYMDMNRGTTSVGSGSLENYYFVPEGAFDVDYYTEINVTLEGQHAIYSPEYQKVLDDVSDYLEAETERLGQERYHQVKYDAVQEYNEGYLEYLDGVQEYKDGKAEAEQELADALQELEDGEKELSRAWQQLQDGRKQLKDGKIQLQTGLQEIRSQKQQASAGLAQVEAALPQARAALAAMGDGSVLKAAMDSAAQKVASTQAAIDAALAENPEADVSGLQAELSQHQAQYSASASAYGQYAAVESKVSMLEGQKAQLEAGLQQITLAEMQLGMQKEKLKEAEDSINAGIAKYKEGKAELEEGWAEYEEAKIEVAQELADAEQELADAKMDLDEAYQEIQDLEEPDTFLLDRTSNVGYNNLDSSSDIVAGVSRVLPVFFLLVASLVCITTMTRMIDEERTQIGTLKALGYSNAAIIGKYMMYSGSGAILGCTLGIILGCTVFPQVIWEAYKIMLYIQPNILLTVNWPLAICVVSIYTAVMLLVTWYCCRRTLQEEPAELIRPKAPDAGKKILLEYLPFWHKISFLNKVTIRNIFRYRQRLLMMLVGIGGCTALLVTGFGLRDSLVSVVDVQFEEVTLYDMEVYFREDISGKTRKEFLNILGEGSSSMFYHQSSVDLEFDNHSKELYMISAGEELSNFIDLHSGESKVSMPQLDQVVLSVGVADMLDIKIGDTLTIRNPDMQTMELTVSGIYDNHVNNYCIVSPQTIEKQWGEKPEIQMAFVRLPEESEVHAMGAKLTDSKEVMNVSISEDMAEMVGNMMKALDLVIILIVCCAGLLAVVVLYNLTNININERIREIATIKVLGFNASETSAYVFKENMTLTVVGSLFGIFLGIALLSFVMEQIKIDMVWFKMQIKTISYVVSVALTLLSAIAVNFIFYFKLQKINMAEALKSVE